MDKKTRALELWQKWFEDEGFPFADNKDGWGSHCFFCKETYPNHYPDCVYPEAKKLIEDNNNSD